MMTTKKSAGNPEVTALGEVLSAVEGLGPDEQVWVFKAVLDKLKLNVDGFDGASQSAKGDRTGAGNRESSKGGGQIPEPPEFFREKKPVTDTQKVACLAYYLTNYRKTSEFKTTDLTEMEIDSKMVKISNPTRAVDNATRKDGVLTTTRAGSKQLTNHGVDVVNALPDQEAVKEILKSHRKGRKRSKRTAKKGSKKA